MDYNPPDSSVHGIFQARILQSVAISSLGDLPNPGIEHLSSVSPELQADFLPPKPSDGVIFMMKEGVDPTFKESDTTE